MTERTMWHVAITVRAIGAPLAVGYAQRSVYADVDSETITDQDRVRLYEIVDLAEGQIRDWLALRPA